MRVVHVISGLSRGGAENVLYRLIESSGNPSNHTIVSMLDEGVYGPRLQSVGATVRCLRMSRGWGSAPGALRRLIDEIKAGQPDVVQTWMSHADLFGGIAARIARKPVCWGIHHGNISAGDHKRRTIAIARLNARLSRRLPTRVVSCSENGARLLAAAGYPTDRIDVIPNGVDVSKFAPLPAEQRSTLRESLGIPGHVKVLGHVGRADAQKDHATMFRAFGMLAERHPDVFLLLAGDGLERGSPYTESLLRSLGGPELQRRVMALGPRDDIPEVMNAIDVFILSSSSGEAFPMVLIEAMASGTPCVATDVGDSAEIIGDTGWLLQPKDPRGLAQAISNALTEDAAAQASRRERARSSIVARYSIQRMVQRYHDVWSRACANFRE